MNIYEYIDGFRWTELETRNKQRTRRRKGKYTKRERERERQTDRERERERSAREPSSTHEGEEERVGTQLAVAGGGEVHCWAIERSERRVRIGQFQGLLGSSI